MSEEFILQFIPYRMKMLGYENYHIRHRSLHLEAGQTLEINAYNQLYFLADEVEGIKIESDYGDYDTTASGSYTVEKVHQHRGLILITNQDSTGKKLKFIQVIIVN